LGNIVLKSLAKADNVVNGVADSPIELCRSLVRSPDLEVHFRASEPVQPSLGLFHEQAPKSLSLTVRMDSEVVDPSAMAFVADHDRCDQPVALVKHKQIVSISG